jgi:hypothetical protein
MSNATEGGPIGSFRRIHIESQLEKENTSNNNISRLKYGGKSHIYLVKIG